MGKNNKIACIHITRNDVRIVEGRVSSGVILISHSAIVQKAGRFFSGDRLANMSDLVSAIVTSMTMNSITAKELYIVYDNNLQVDFFLDEKGDLYINEIHTIPGFTSISMFPMSFKAKGLSYSGIIDKLLDFAVKEHKK